MSRDSASTQLQAKLGSSRVEKDVENAYRAGISSLRPKAEWDSPHGTDGRAQWGGGNPATVRLLLESKYNKDLKSRIPVCGVLGQMIGYLKKFEQAGEVLPNVLLVGDRDECFVLSTEAVRGFLSLDLDWSFAPSAGSPELTRALVQGFNLLPYVYDVDDNLDFSAVVEQVEVLASGSKHQVRATPSNLGAIFLYWRDRVFTGKRKASLTPTEQVDVFLRCLFQPADVYPHPTKSGILVVPGYPEGVRVSAEQYRSFFDHFAQGYKPSEIEKFYAMKDRLVEDDARRRQGAFFTPRLWVEEAHKELDRVLGTGWRKECVVWDPAAGTANLTRDYHDWGCLISSTAERPDVQVMKEQGWGGHHVFQYDFLNPGAESPFFDSEDQDKNVIPPEVEKVLRGAAEAGKRLVILMNPPYGTAGSGKGADKGGIAINAANKEMKARRIGLAAQQLYAQFMWASSKKASERGFQKNSVALFSKPAFVCSDSYRNFRDWWYKRYSYDGGFLFQASHFADVSGAWGVSFTVWSSEGKTDSDSALLMRLCDEEDFSVVGIGPKHLTSSTGRKASKWVYPVSREKGREDTPKFGSGLTVYSEANSGGPIYNGGVSSDALLVFVNKGNSMQDSPTATLLSGRPTDPKSCHHNVFPENWRRAAALFGARKLVKGTWINDKDEYLVPDTSLLGYDQWVDDCHVYAIFHGSNNCTAMRDVDYKDKLWRIKNHWFWRTREDALEALDTVETPTLYRDNKAEPCKSSQVNQITGDEETQPWEFTGDPYMAHILPKLKLSPDALHLLNLLDGLWLRSLPLRENYAAGKPELHLTAWDAGVYQLKHLWRDLFPDEWKELKAAHKALSQRLEEGVFTYGFLLR